MSLAQIKEKIKADAEREAKQIREKAHARVEVISKRAKEEIACLEANAAEKVSKERPEVFKRRNIVANLDVKRLLLGSRRRLIRDVFEDTLISLDNLPQTEYLALSETLLLRAIENGNEEIRVSQSEKYITAEWVASFNQKHAKQITLSDKKADISGGFILVKGRIYTNCSWGSLIQIMQENREMDVVQRLFPA